MAFRIRGLAPDPFRHLFGASDAVLARYGARRYTADGPGFPDRVELRDAEPGETLLLLNHVHQPAETPFRASHAIFIREGAGQAADLVDQVPAQFRTRTLSLRAFSAEGLMVDAGLVEGTAVQTLIARLFENPDAAYLHAHFAARGCYAARIERA